MFFILDTVWKDAGRLRSSKVDERRIHAEVGEMMNTAFLHTASHVIEQQLRNGLRDYFREDELHGRPAGVVDVSDAEDGASTVDVDLFLFIRELVGGIATKTFMGSTFARKNPQFLADLWELDRNMLALLLKADRLPVRSFRGAGAARDRVIGAVKSHHHDLLAEITNPRGRKNRDASDLFETRIRKWTQDEGLDVETCARADAAILWAANVNSAPIAFWMVWHLYRHNEFLDLVRQELTPYFTTGDRGRSPRSADISAVVKDCHLLRAAFWETLRLEAHTFTFKRVSETFVLEKAVTKESDRPISGYKLTRGQFVAIHHGSHQTNPAVFPDPERFDPTRFLRVVETDSGAEWRFDAAHDICPFSAGRGICRGRSFAKMEVLMTVATIIWNWDLEIADPASLGGFDARVSTSGANLPVKEVRARLHCR